ncbi:MAG TPA: hypothetical protein VLI41_02290 [Phenylobacterium sp.]|uniref:hypothetical protein n=1 Tax=Phenylobacterium sp. TaxID=1871053 RepID=UPI002CD8E5D9|nr:hypothetical protein [Phenylobacterium sp.]HSV02009.1 hypothetical protein [Phenylobacterium sp.]
MFDHWDSFYLLVGGAAGALIGLLFIVATLNKGLDADSALRGASVYMTPIVVHLGLVLTISGLAAAPGLTRQADGLVLALATVVGVISAGRVILHLAVTRLLRAAHWTDVWCYGALPLGAYLALGASTAAIWLRPDWAARGVAVSLLAVLLIAIRNAWDLVTWISAKAPAAPAGETR